MHFRMTLSPSTNRHQKAGKKNNLQKFKQSLVVGPFGLLCLRSSFCPCQLFFSASKQNSQSIKSPRIINGFCFRDSSPIEMTPKMATWKFHVTFGNPVFNTAGWFAKGPNKSIQNWHDFFKAKRIPLAQYVARWCHDVMSIKVRLKMPIQSMPVTKRYPLELQIEVVYGKEN